MTFAPLHFTRTQVNDMVRRYKAGERMTAIAESYQCTLPPIRNILAAEGVVIRSKGPYVPDKARRDRAIRAARRRGESYSTIGRRFELSAQRVFQICKSEAA